jgi:serine/threonine protein kinase
VKKPEDSADAPYLPLTEEFSHRGGDGQPSASARRKSDDSQGDSSSIPDDPRLMHAVHEYMQELEAGRRPDRQEWLTRYPDLREALGQCLEGLDILHRAAPLGQPPLLGAQPAANQTDDGLPSSPVGDFQIVREIGRGGMGIVYEAIQLSLGRRVAMKVLPFAATFDSKQLQRFHQEAQAAAQLHHTNIVPVYAVGCERGIHYYAMQLIEGHSLDFVIRQLQQEAGDKGPGPGTRKTQGESAAEKSAHASTRPSASPVPPSALPVPVSSATETLGRLSAHFSTLRSGREGGPFRFAAQAMAQAAEALEYAHQQGIIHRDVKPANLLIDVRGNVWITDFGLAHFRVDSGLTQTGDVLGTVRYMSPEQASGQRVVLDHRTDVYSLGATFYELLTLQPMFDGTSRQSLLMQVLNRDPRPLRAIDRTIPAELETIVLKALAKSPAERYATAQELADDLYRFLRDEPIRARRPSPLEHARKWARRHPAVIGSVVLMMFLLLLVSLLSNWLITRANERYRLRSEEAEERFVQAKGAVDLLIEASEEELANRGPFQNLRKRLLEAALGYYQGFIAQRRDDPSAQAELIAVEKRIKKVLDDLSLLEGAGQLILLSDRRIQDDLGLNDSQRKQLEATAQTFSQRRRDSLDHFSRLTPRERRERYLELARTNDQAMRSILTPAQLKRLEQATLQLQGPNAFGQPEVIASLHLSDAQRQSIRQIEDEGFAALWGHRHGGSGRAITAATRETVMRATMDKILALLGPEQLADWKGLIGSPVQDVYNIPHHGFGMPPWGGGHPGFHGPGPGGPDEPGHEPARPIGLGDEPDR